MSYKLVKFGTSVEESCSYSFVQIFALKVILRGYVVLRKFNASYLAKDHVPFNVREACEALLALTHIAGIKDNLILHPRSR